MTPHIIGRKKMKTKSKLSFFTDKPYLIWAILFIIAPLLMVAYYALTDKTGAFSLASRRSYESSYGPATVQKR